MLYVLFFIMINPSWALPSDKDAIVYLNAGTASLNQINHQGIYTHQVTLDQGTTHLRAAYAMIEGDAHNQLKYAIAKGESQQQAHIWTTTDLNKPPLHAYADTIRYYPQEHRVELQGHARVEQGPNSFSAPEISYNTLTQHVVTKQHGNERTTIIIQPSSRS